MGRRTRAAMWITMLAAFAGAGPATRPVEHHSAAYGYTITVPDGWTQIPIAEIRKTSAAVHAGAAQQLVQYDVGFQPATNKEWLTYPYSLVQVIPYATFGTNRQLTDAEVDAVVKVVTASNLPKAMDDGPSKTARAQVSDAAIGTPKLDRATGRLTYPVNAEIASVGKVRGMNYAFFGRRALVQVAIASTAADWDRYAQVAEDLGASFRFDPAEAFSHDPAATQPAAGR